MAITPNCDLRCAICPNGDKWDIVAPNAANAIFIDDEQSSAMVETARIALVASEDEAMKQPKAQELGDMADITVELVAGEAAIRATLAAELDKIGQRDCEQAGICRLPALVEAINVYNDEGLALAERVEPRLEE
ncbi:MAG TPA: hypothetical protein VLF62_03470 [Candidatus Saccharimonadales bacterium]|nr:hypothetical protein [Candidatus Saccharimonadales bacterium]